MREYLVRYEIEISAHSPEDAALRVYEIMRDPATLPPILDVVDVSSGDEVSVDLEDLP